MTDYEPVPYFNLKGQFAEFKEQWFEEIETIGRSGNFILGNAVSDIEKRLADYLGVRHAVTVSSGTDALVIALKAVGVEPGDSVIVPDFTYFATAEAVSLIGAIPKFVDIDPVDFNLDVDRLESAIDHNTKAIIPVHLFGCPARVDEICKIAADHGVKVVEDVAQAFGAKLNRSNLGKSGDAGCFSFYPTKILGAFGDGGMVTTDDDEVYETLKLLRNHGITGLNQHDLIGCTSRLNATQAVLLKIKLEKIKQFIELRKKFADFYISELQGLDLTFPMQRSGTEHVYNIFTIRCNHRIELVKALQKQNIGYQIYYPKPVHKQSPYLSSGFLDKDFPQSHKACETVLSLPLYHDMPESHLERTVIAVKNALQ